MRVFISKPGRIAVLRETGILPGSVKLNPGGFTAKTIITGLGVSQGANVQFQHSLKNAIYVYSFGDRMGAVKVSGLGFAEDCRGGGQSGVEELLRYYAAHRISENGELVEVRIGAQPVRGYLVACDIGIASPELMTYAWNLTIATLPETKETVDRAPDVVDPNAPPPAPNGGNNNPGGGGNTGTTGSGGTGVVVPPPTNLATNRGIVSGLL